MISNELFNKVRGSSLVIAIFVLVVMSLLGTSIIKMLRTSEQTYVYEVLGTRAYASAQSGVQWKLQQIFPLTTVFNTSQCIASTIDFSNHEGLNDCRALVECTSKAHNDSNVTYFTITSTGQCDINGEQTSRVVEVSARSSN
jgi:MSHA biogenesis protein MshP